jgi:hypothetical protein
MNRAQLLERYEEARLAQGEFWDALSALEEAIGFEIDGTRDLADTDVDALLLADEIARECDAPEEDNEGEQRDDAAKAKSLRRAFKSKTRKAK